MALAQSDGVGGDVEWRAGPMASRYAWSEKQIAV